MTRPSPPRTVAGAAVQRALALTLVGLVTLAVGCNSRHTPEQSLMRLGDGMSDVFRGTHHARSETIRVDAAVPLSLDIETFNGDVKVVANPRARHATVVITRESTFGFLGERERKTALESIGASAELVPGDLGPALRVRVSTDDAQSHFQRAHVWIEAPEIEDVRIRTDHGRVDVRRAHGRVDIEARRGSLLYATPEAITQSVTMVTSDGDIDFRAGPGTTGDFDAESIGGRVLQRTNVGRWISVDGANSHRRVRSRLQNGANPIVLRAAEGNVRIAIVEDPMAFGLMIIDP